MGIWLDEGGELDPCLAKIFGLWKLVSNICGANAGQRLPGVRSVTLCLFAVIPVLPVLLQLGLSLLQLPLPHVFRLVGSGGGVGPERDDHAGHVVTPGAVSGGVRGQTLPQKLQREETGTVRSKQKRIQRTMPFRNTLPDGLCLFQRFTVQSIRPSSQKNAEKEVSAFGT